MASDTYLLGAQWQQSNLANLCAHGSTAVMQPQTCSQPPSDGHMHFCTGIPSRLVDALVKSIMLAIVFLRPR